RVRRAFPAGPACEPPVAWSPTDLSYALDDAIAFGVGIERHRRAKLHREVAPILDRIHDDHLAGAGDARGLHGTESHRARAEDDDVRAGLEAHVRVTCGEARCELIAEECQLRGRQVGEERDAVLL